MPTESWVGAETFIDGQYAGSSWDICQLGEIYLPGVITIEDFEYGQDIDVQKRRKKEKPRIRDNGLAPCAFTIKVELRASQWIEWQKKLPHIQPRREGAVRTPLAIVHPLPNTYGVNSIYIHKIKTEAPSARKGMVITIRVAEWFEEEKDSKGPTKKSTPENPIIPKYTKPDYFGDPNKLAKALQGNAGYPTTDAQETEMRILGGG
jgi:hypothetical protein